MADIFSSIEKLINEHGSAAILKERIAQLMEHMELLEKKNANLQEQNNKLEVENGRLKALTTQVSTTGFREYRGLLWKAEGSGYEPTPYCPKCKTVMSSLPPAQMGRRMHWMCSQCKMRTDPIDAPVSAN